MNSYGDSSCSGWGSRADYRRGANSKEGMLEYTALATSYTSVVVVVVVVKEQPSRLFLVLDSFVCKSILWEGTVGQLSKLVLFWSALHAVNGAFDAGSVGSGAHGKPAGARALEVTPEVRRALFK